MNEKWHDSQGVRRGMECPGGKLSQPGSKRLINRQIPSVRPLASVASEVLQCQFPATWTFSEWYLKTMTPHYSNRRDSALGQRRRLQQGNSTWPSVSIWSIMVSSPTASMSAPREGQEKAQRTSRQFLMACILQNVREIRELELNKFFQWIQLEFNLRPRHVVPRSKR